MKIKKEIRIVGIDDSPIENKKAGEEVRCIGTIYRGGNYMDGLLSFKVEKDGVDSTKKIIKSIKETKHKDQLKVIMIDGITLAGFNIVDIDELYKNTKLPVISIMRKKPNMEKFLKALENMEGERKTAVEKAGKPKKVRFDNRELFVQSKGLDLEEIKEILSITCINSNIPEPLRVSHLIASGVHYGESHGSA